MRRYYGARHAPPFDLQNFYFGLALLYSGRRILAAGGPDFSDRLGALPCRALSVTRITAAG